LQLGFERGYVVEGRSGTVATVRCSSVACFSTALRAGGSALPVPPNHADLKERPMTSARDLRAAIIENRAQLQAALHGAHAAWEQTPAAPEGGEESWSPRQVAEHLVSAEWLFTDRIAQAGGATAGAHPTVDAATPAATAAWATRVGASCDDILRQISDGDMEKAFEHPRMGTRTVAQMLEILVSHGKDHVDQLRRAAGS
jgi:hypothetical protein